MPWTFLDEKFHSNGKVTDAGNAAVGLYARALSYCGDLTTDGFVRGSWANSNGKPAERKRLTEAELWRPVKKGDQVTVETKRGAVTVTMPGDGYFIDDYLVLNPSRDEVEAQRKQNADRQAKWRETHRGDKGRFSRHGASNDADNASSNALRDGYVTPPPCPTPLSSKEEASTRDAAPLEGTISNELLLARLVAAAGGGPQVAGKVANTLRGYRISEHDLVETIGLVTGPGVRDALGVALGELTKRRRKAA